MSERFHTIEARGVRLTLDLDAGHVRRFEIEHGGRTIIPLHTAPWVDDAAVAADPATHPNLKHLAGDFFCAPFGKSDVEETPPHGWPANSRWELLDVAGKPGATTARYELQKRVMGARLVKAITLRDFHPFAYQRHVFEGGRGAVSAASHAMTHFATTGRLSFSPKAFGELPSIQQESDPARGRSVFAKSVRFTDLTRLPLADGTFVDLHAYPVASGHEDFAMLVEAKENRLGWTAAGRPDKADLMLSLKNPADFPVTFLWFSNGGRYYAPWNRRHLGVLGIEEGRAYSAYGHAASIAPNPLSDAGIPTSLTLTPTGTVALHHVLGGVPLGADPSVTSIDTHGDSVSIVDGSGAVARYPFDGEFLAKTGR